MDNNSAELLKKGDQIAYIPDYAENDLGHPDVEFGFVMSKRKYADSYMVVCRFWLKGYPAVLRTLTNSESVPSRNLIRINIVSQSVVDVTLADIKEQEEKDEQHM